MATALDLKIDVSGAVGFAAPVSTAATVHLPEPDKLPDRPVVCFAFPGGGYNRQYFSLDLGTGGGMGNGQAAWHTARGWVFVTCDHLGVGESSVLEPDLTTYEMIAAANRTTVETVLEKLSEGSLTPGFPRLSDPVTLGLGQSMGGCFTIVAQAHHRLFDGIGLLGYSGIHTVVPSPPGTPDLTMPIMPRTGYPAEPRILNEADLAASTHAAVSDESSLAEAAGAGEHPWTWVFHHDDEPREMVVRDMAALTGGEVAPWRSATTPACAILMVAPGTVATEAASIDVPVLIAVGERDVVPDPWMEPKAFPRSPDISVFVNPRTAHMHNFSPTRERFWARIHSWGTHVAEQLEIPA